MSGWTPRRGMLVARADCAPVTAGRAEEFRFTRVVVTKLLSPSYVPWGQAAAMSGSPVTIPEGNVLQMANSDGPVASTFFEISMI